MLNAATIKSLHSAMFTFLGGNLDAQATICRRPDETCPQSLVFVSDARQLEDALSRRAAILILHRQTTLDAGQSLHSSACMFTVSAIAPAMAVLLKYFDRKAARFVQWGARHPSAVVHETATLGRNVVLGPFCVIGAGASIGDDCYVGSHTAIENDVRIGDRTILHPHVFVGAGCEVGRDCEIHPHTSIGSDGFGYAPDATGKPVKISQLGNVRIHDDVEIGSNCAIDRATLTSTHIRSGTKLDNLCHVAHNCDLGENGLYTAGFMAAGSTTIGRHFISGGNTVVSAHLTVADNVVLAGRSTVTKHVNRSGAYGGYPLQPLKDALRTTANLGRITRMRRDLNKVLRRLDLRGENDAAAD